eukprot:EG_transcript_9402
MPPSRPLLAALRFVEPFASKWRQFLFRVHPDFFGATPDRRRVNEDSLKALSTVVQPHNAGSSLRLTFWLRPLTPLQEPTCLTLDLTVQRSTVHTLQPLLAQAGIAASAAEGEPDLQPVFEAGLTDLAGCMQQVLRACRHAQSEYQDMEREARLLERLIYSRTSVPVRPRGIALEPYLMALKRWWQELERNAMKPILQTIRFHVYIIPVDEAPATSSCTRWGDVWHDDNGDVCARSSQDLSYVVQFIHSRRGLIDRAFQGGEVLRREVSEAQRAALDACMPLRALVACPTVGLAHRLTFLRRFEAECAAAVNALALGGPAGADGAHRALETEAETEEEAGALHLAVTGPNTTAPYSAEGYLEVRHDCPTPDLLALLRHTPWAGPARRFRRRANAHAAARRLGEAVTAETGVEVLFNPALPPDAMAHAAATLHAQRGRWRAAWAPGLPLVVGDRFKVRGDGALCIPWHASCASPRALPP